MGTGWGTARDLLGTPRPDEMWLGRRRRAEGGARTTKDNSCGSTKRDESHIATTSVNSTNVALDTTLANAIAFAARSRCANRCGRRLVETKPISGEFRFFYLRVFFIAAMTFSYLFVAIKTQLTSCLPCSSRTPSQVSAIVFAAPV